MAVVIAVMLMPPCALSQSPPDQPESKVRRYPVPKVSEAPTVESMSKSNAKEIERIKSDMALMKFQISRLENHMAFLYALLYAMLNESEKSEKSSWLLQPSKP
jgi:hypothetical protein